MATIQAEQITCIIIGVVVIVVIALTIYDCTIGHDKYFKKLDNQTEKYCDELAKKIIDANGK